MSCESSDGESCTCPICLEPLIQSSSDGSNFIGTTVPCGHCLHVHCWDQWTATSIGRMQGRLAPIHVKCPLCNVPTTSFVRLYLNLNGTSSSVPENDDDSLFESDAEDDEVQIVEMGTDDSTKESAPSAKTEKVEEKDEGNSGGSVDVRNSKKYKKCKAMLRKLQHENKLLQSQNQERNGLCQQLQSKVKAHEEHLRAMQEKIDHLEQHVNTTRLSMEGLSYQMVQTKRILENLENNLKTLEEQKKQKDIQLIELKQRYDQRIRDMQKKQENMQEIQHILSERPKLVEEVRSLKEQLRRMQRQQLQVSLAARGDARESTHARKEALIPKSQGTENATHKQRKRMLAAIREELEDTKNPTTLLRKKQTTREIQRNDRPITAAQPATSNAKTFVTELLKKPPAKAPLQIVVPGKPLVRQVTATMVPPTRSVESTAMPRDTAPRRKQATLFQFSKHKDDRASNF